LDSQLKAIGDSTVALISIDDVTDNNDGTYSIPSATLAETYLDRYGRPLCPNVPFIDQPTVAICTDFLVAPDMIATTGHCNDTHSVKRAFKEYAIKISRERYKLSRDIQISDFQPAGDVSRKTYSSSVLDKYLVGLKLNRM
jgi:hypothetical protein